MFSEFAFGHLPSGLALFLSVTLQSSVKSSRCRDSPKRSAHSLPTYNPEIADPYRTGFLYYRHLNFHLRRLEYCTLYISHPLASTSSLRQCSLFELLRKTAASNIMKLRQMPLHAPSYAIPRLKSELMVFDLHPYELRCENLFESMFCRLGFSDMTCFCV